MKVVIFGANGQSGRLVTGHALAAGRTVVAVTRGVQRPLAEPSAKNATPGGTP